MHRPTMITARSLVAVTMTALLTLSVAACGSNDDGGKASTTTAPVSATTKPKGSTNNQQVSDELTKGWRASLKAAGFDSDEQECIIRVSQEAMYNAAPSDAFNERLESQCDVSLIEMFGGMFYAAFKDQGMEETKASCLREYIAGLSLAEFEKLKTDTSGAVTAAKDCGVDISG